MSRSIYSALTNRNLFNVLLYCDYKSKFKLKNANHLLRKIKYIEIKNTESISTSACVSTSTITDKMQSPVLGKKSLTQRILKFFELHAFGKKQLSLAGSLLYTKIDERIDLPQFFTVCDMPDTFYSWFLVTELHVWMLSVRLMAEGEEGKIVRNSLITALFLDLDERSKKLENALPSARKEQVQELKEMFSASMLSYDEALNGSDQILASALWRTMFLKNCDDPERIECCIHYIRRNLMELDKVHRIDLIKGLKFKFAPLLEPEQIRTS